MFESLDACAAAGADLLSIESTGGKEVHDKALLRGDVEGIALALGVLAPRDMAWLWDGFVAAARRHGCVAAGDSACGFANTAMQLAGRGMLPDVLAALVRAMSAARSLVAFERGAVGPSKDCAYEGPVLKAITGFPISMEGRSATCAHLSPIGNIAGAAADLWSNESVPDVRLLSGPAPVASLESLAYDCRLFNAATARGQALVLRDLHVASDCGLSPQAFLLTPEASLMLAAVITGEHDPYRRTVAAARAAIKWLGGAGESLRMSAREGDWLDRLSRGADALPDSESDLLARTHARYGKLFDSLTYGLSP
jgi:methanol--5-hydroxybenzimidazolylcobamide Co-methyltransferase